MPRRTAPPTKLERMFKHVLESSLDQGHSLARAEQIAASTVNKHRASLARGRITCKPRRKPNGRTVVHCRVARGPKLVRDGGSRRQWYPGKKRAKGKKKERLTCLAHGRSFKTRGGLKRHYASHHRRAMRRP